MNVFEFVKQNVTARQVADYYGIPVNRHGLACCPFHNDRHPSMKIDVRFYCFACGQKGDAINFVEKYFGLSPKDAALKICQDFGLDYKPDKPKGSNKTHKNRSKKNARARPAKLPERKRIYTYTPCQKGSTNKWRVLAFCWCFYFVWNALGPWQKFLNFFCV